MAMETESGLQSADRLFQIMELLSLHGRGLPLSEICKETGLPKGTASRMLSALIAHGYAAQDVENRKYRLTMLDEKFRTVRGGKGIAYTIPMSSVVGVAIYQFLSDNRMSRKEGQ